MHQMRNSPAEASCERVSCFNSVTSFTELKSAVGGGRLIAGEAGALAAAARAWMLVVYRSQAVDTSTSISATSLR